ncbi:MAG: hypothetical protein K2L70_08150 [Clostridia bacterium]|nr:hypothetical protein [Clostridia bacterium]
MSKSNNTHIVSISAEKNYIMAKVFLPNIEKFDKVIFDRLIGYDLYYINDKGHWEEYKEEVLNNINKKNSLNLTVYCVKNDITIKIPFGFCENEELRGNGVVELKLMGRDSLEKFMKNCPDKSWESYRVGDINYQYLTEYFIDSAYSQNGFSLTLRKIFKRILQEKFKTNFEIQMADKEKIKKILNDYLVEQKYGLTVDSVSYSSFKKNSGSEGENK